MTTIEANGNPAAERDYVQLVEAHRSELHAHCDRMLRSEHDAEEAVQEALLRAWKGLPRFEGRSSVRSWLYSIATNAALDQIARRPRPIAPIDLDHPADPHEGPAARYEHLESVERTLRAANEHLPESQLAVLVHRVILGLSAEETADALGMTIAAVNSALQRARVSLREQLHDQVCI